MKTPPFFSIIIPTYNRPDQLTACLQALTLLDYPPTRFEVIIVDDGSPVSLEPVVNELAENINIKLIRQTNAGPATARNFGATQARGELLVFTDDDCLPATDWLRAFAQQVIAHPNSLIGGHTINALPNTRFSTASQTLVSYLYDYYGANNKESSFFTSNNLAVLRTEFQALGGFDTNFPLAAGEDRDFCIRWSEAGKQMVYAPRALVYHTHAMTLRSFWRQHFNYGRGAFNFHRQRAHRNREPIRIESIGFYLNLLLYPFSKMNATQASSITGLLFLSQVANAAGFFRERIRQPTYTLGASSS